MVIVIAGIKRSASTACFNMVRLVCEASGEEVHTWGNAYQIKDGINIIKVHPFNKKLYNKADYIFTTDRKDEDILKSLERFSGGGNPKRLKKMRKNLELWERKSNKLHYNHIVNSPLKCIEYIAEVLGVDVDCKAILKEFEAIKPPKKGYDPETFLF
ncbi:MAG: hypothetical protein GWN01_07545, partial [Nitrosopumilaceae archaeon]|nr:hypothetical protein [Nitrosopumilaceae archaeon]NIU87223.1 hypothetical protein [Nitrosopumilaceae archaeon]NIX61376.1 hypothetical protein [Nitrosopumilaceae archaeon]